MNETDKKKKTILKPYCLKDLQELYGVTYATLKLWLKGFETELGERVGRYYSIKQVKMIFEKLGTPGQEIETA
jgi:hypothetical protein